MDHIGAELIEHKRPICHKFVGWKRGLVEHSEVKRVSTTHVICLKFFIVHGTRGAMFGSSTTDTQVPIYVQLHVWRYAHAFEWTLKEAPCGQVGELQILDAKYTHFGDTAERCSV